MWQEGYDEGNEDLTDDVSESFVRCALHQARIIRERWKFWSGTVPADVSIRLHRLESLLSISKEDQQQQLRSIAEIVEYDKQQSLKASSNNNYHPKEIPLNMSTNPLQLRSKINASQPFLAEIRNYSVIDHYFTERLEPKQNIILQGPDLQRIVLQKRRVQFWCCH